MGYEAACSLTVEGRRFQGTARLESKDLTFRGETRLTIPLADVSTVVARGDDLLIAFGSRSASLAIGADAARWAERIANPPSRSKKLGIKPGMRVAMVGLADGALVREIADAGAVIAPASARGLAAIFYGVHAPKELDRLKTLAARLDPAGVLWLVRAKGKAAPVSEAASMAAGKRAGLVDVKVVSFDDLHTAEKYVIPVARRSSGVRRRAGGPGTRGSALSRARTSLRRPSR
jgi:hypothetical protein